MKRITPYELIVIASILWLGYVGSKAFQRIKLPSVTGFLLVGVLLGPQALNLLNENILHRLSFIEPLALGVMR